ncbi:MarR family winged helix-turn-helix transcriptional regulator [Actinocorallia sp. A-T 12471]|uniref:MarR family winged helix-turn-helix transcriptional regulator n=1 Tax=Actinocorallia sp. A-T 12471 TaxID=3089813 RepID=UPI0029D2911E|nr:MarR family transcriptional regulator [Actinocorallia sp. A-T 12471]MDX6741271.1 MarR family transcriptional regulator [Actinocorallia sp. A-T 12471]
MARWLDDGEQQTWRAYLWSTQLLHEALDRQMQQESGIPQSYYVMLAMLSEAPGRSRTMTELARVTRGSPSKVSHAVRKLEESGWVRRHKHPDDARTTIATLTDEGYAVVVKAAPGHVEAVRENLFDLLTPEQTEQLGAICRAMLARLDPDGPSFR